MAKYKLHCFCQSGNAYKLALYLNCAGLDWEPVFVDFMNGATREPDWRANVNAFGEVPVLEVDGKKMTQSGAVLLHLAETTGKFAPADADAMYEARRWILFDNHRFTSFFATHRFMFAFMTKEPSPDVMAFLKGRWEPAAAIVDRHLSENRFLLGDEPTIADFSLAGYMFYPPEETGYDLGHSYGNIHAWTERMKALPGWKDPYQLMPGEHIPPVKR